MSSPSPQVTNLLNKTTFLINTHSCVLTFVWQTAEPEFSYSTLFFPFTIFFPLLLRHMLVTFSNEKWKTYSVESSVHKELLSTYYMVGTALGIWDTLLNKTDKVLPSWSLH